MNVFNALLFETMRFILENIEIKDIKGYIPGVDRKEEPLSN